MRSCDDISFGRPLESCRGIGRTQPACRFENCIIAGIRIKTCCCVFSIDHGVLNFEARFPSCDYDTNFLGNIVIWKVLVLMLSTIL